MTTITNSFHGSEVTINANVGEEVSASTLRRVRRALCGISGCTCCREDGSRDSRFHIEIRGCDKSTSPMVVVDSKAPLICLG